MSGSLSGLFYQICFYGCGICFSTLTLSTYIQNFAETKENGEKAVDAQFHLCLEIFLGLLISVSICWWLWTNGVGILKPLADDVYFPLKFIILCKYCIEFLISYSYMAKVLNVSFKFKIKKIFVYYMNISIILRILLCYYY